MSDETTNLLCAHCGQTFSAFLHEMADHNAKVVCPSCGQAHGGKAPKVAKPATRARPVKRTH